MSAFVSQAPGFGRQDWLTVTFNNKLHEVRLDMLGFREAPRGTEQQQHIDHFAAFLHSLPSTLSMEACPQFLTEADRSNSDRSG